MALENCPTTPQECMHPFVTLHIKPALLLTKLVRKPFTTISVLVQTTIQQLNIKHI